MPIRKTIFTNAGIYHIYNRSLNNTAIFSESRLAQYFLDALEYYLKEKPPVKFSIYKTVKNRDIYPVIGSHLVDIYGFVVMPNHFHIVVKQLLDDGIQIFIQRLSNSFSHFYNIVNKRKGPLFESVFKAVQIESDEQLVHTLRYVDLNPTTSNLVKDPSEYSYSSYQTHIGENNLSWVNTSFIKERFKNLNQYKKFVLDNKDYQRSLHRLKKLS